MKQLHGRVAVVTGAANGIGEALATALAAEGCAVVLADVDRAGIDRVADVLTRGGARVREIATDVSQADSVDRLAAFTIEQFGAVHIVCNNAGISPVGSSIADAPIDDWRWAFEVNVLGVVHGIRSFLPLLVEQEEAHIVNTASVTSFFGSDFNGPYCASKAAVLSISETLFRELAADGITSVGVSALCPGAVLSTLGRSRERRPAHLPAAGEGAQNAALAARLSASRAKGIPASAAADATIEAIREERFYILTHPSDELIRQRSDRAIARLPPAIMT